MCWDARSDHLLKPVHQSKGSLDVVTSYYLHCCISDKQHQSGSTALLVTTQVSKGRVCGAGVSYDEEASCRGRCASPDRVEAHPRRVAPLAAGRSAHMYQSPPQGAQERGEQVLNIHAAAVKCHEYPSSLCNTMKKGSSPLLWAHLPATFESSDQSLLYNRCFITGDVCKQ